MSTECLGSIARHRSPQPRAAAVTAWGIHVPGLDVAGLVGGRGSGPACPPERAHELLGRKKLAFKEPATRLALCAVHRAFKLPPEARFPERAPDPRTAVVVSSNLGNVATIHGIVHALRRGGIRDVSPLDAPNASSNVIASTVALWFRLGGPNLMVCSGATSGLDAIACAQLLLRAGRADRVVVVGVEPGDEIASRLYAQRAGVHGKSAPALHAAAAAVLLEPATASCKHVYLSERVSSAAEMRAGLDQLRPPVVIGPAELASGTARLIDLGASIGDTYGASGVLQIAIAAALIEAQQPETSPSVVAISGDEADGWRAAIVNGERLRDVPKPFRSPA